MGVGHKVMVVDDHDLVRSMLCAKFRDQGFEVCDAVDGLDAVERAPEQAPDVIVLDLAMPMMNGLEAAHVLKQLMPQVRMVMFTNNAGPAVEREAHSSGISSVYSKSDSADLLVAWVRAQLG